MVSVLLDESVRRSSSLQEEIRTVRIAGTSLSDLSSVFSLCRIADCLHLSLLSLYPPYSNMYIRSALLMTWLGTLQDRVFTEKEEEEYTPYFDTSGSSHDFEHCPVVAL